jgi:hypothetical protein
MLEDSSTKLIRQKQVVARNELSLNRERERLRKADTRRKIQLGGLIVKAGLAEEPSSVILGLLCDARSRLPNEKVRRQDLGDHEFQKGQNV